MPEPTNAKLFGDLLRAFREEAGISQTELAKAAYCSQSLISGLETGARGTRIETFVAIDGAVGAKGKLVIMWPVTASDAQTLENLVALEAEATTIEESDNRVIPGLLQTPDYARAVIRNGRSRITKSELDRLVTSRMERQAIWQRDEPPLSWFIIDEGILYKPHGGKEVMREMLLKLESAAEQPGMFFQVLPFANVRHPGFEGPLRIMEFLDRAPIWYTEGVDGSGRLSDSKDEVSAQRLKFGLIRAAALPPEQSTEFIASVRGSHYE
jgi:transcriptional regulator with XRE-family HTH domain